MFSSSYSSYMNEEVRKTTYNIIKALYELAVEEKIKELKALYQPITTDVSEELQKLTNNLDSQGAKNTVQINEAFNHLINVMTLDLSAKAKDMASKSRSTDKELNDYFLNSLSYQTLYATKVFLTRYNTLLTQPIQETPDISREVDIKDKQALIDGYLERMKSLQGKQNNNFKHAITHVVTAVQNVMSNILLGALAVATLGYAPLVFYKLSEDDKNKKYKTHGYGVEQSLPKGSLARHLFWQSDKITPQATKAADELKTSFSPKA